jgi:hypothetical protein
MWKVHFIMNGKGGVGKSTVGAFIANYLRHIKEPVVCVDADPLNATLAGYKAFAARRIELMNGAALDEAQFDRAAEMFLTEEAHFIVDTGASAFIPVSNYLIENEVHAQIRACGKQAVVHAIIVGGGTLVETLGDLDKLATQLDPEVEIVVWLNEYFGLIEDNGKTFEQMKVYEKHRARIYGIIHIPRQTQTTFGEDIKRMITLRLTFDEAVYSPDFFLMSKHRLHVTAHNLYKQMAVVI